MYVLKDKNTNKYWCGKSSWGTDVTNVKLIKSYEEALIIQSSRNILDKVNCEIIPTNILGKEVEFLKATPIK